MCHINLLFKLLCKKATDLKPLLLFSNSTKPTFEVYHQRTLAYRKCTTTGKLSSANTGVNCPPIIIFCLFVSHSLNQPIAARTLVIRWRGNLSRIENYLQLAKINKVFAETLWIFHKIRVRGIILQYIARIARS